MAKRLDPEKVKWNERIEKEYQEHKQMEIDKKKKALIELNVENVDNKKSIKNEQLKAYNGLKKQFIIVDDNETIGKWKILSKAYKLGKDIYGQKFSVVKLSYDFDIPYTTCKRVLSLDKTNKRTWNLIHEGKISAFKVAQICMSRNIKYQDQLVDLIIKKRFSTTDIKNIRMTKDGLDVKTARLEKAVKEGYSRKSSAFKGLKDTVYRMIKLLDIPVDEFSETNFSEMISLLDELQVKTNKKIEELIQYGK